CPILILIDYKSSMSSNSLIPAQAGIQNVKLKKPFYPISFCAGGPGFPPARA
ncbi:hypothetical protein HMPREF3156_00324, partial [Neisseria sp. HMSC06F02]